ncbi:hypothetical protein CHELA41_51456 [Hyphomicrobiales bacterium]|nr:hypothetical protein CHELA41_51456 [Hyphomicrobiales bacterium]
MRCPPKNGIFISFFPLDMNVKGLINYL